MATTTITRPCPPLAGAYTAATCAAEKPAIWYDYALQVWVKHDLVEPCGHPRHMWPGCCAAERFHGMWSWEARQLAGLCGCDTCCSAEWIKVVTQ